MSSSRSGSNLADDRDVNAILLTGAGKAFSVGDDITSRDKPLKSKGRGGRRIVMADGRRVIENILDVEQPIVAAINGDALGFAANVALLCDVTVAAETAKLADTHVALGAVAGDGGAVIWPLLIGPNRAKEFLMLGDTITGADAARIGLVNYALPAEQVMPKARELAQRLAVRQVVRNPRGAEGVAADGRLNAGAGRVPVSIRPVSVCDISMYVPTPSARWRRKAAIKSIAPK